MAKMPPWTQAEDDILIQMHRSGASSPKIAAMLSGSGRTQRAVNHRIFDLGLPLRPKRNFYGTIEYRIWAGVIARCYNPNRPAFSTYGAVGISVCDRWRKGDAVLSGFELFLADMGPCPSETHSIDRWPDMAGNYEPGNCRWATKLEQANNRRNTRRIVYRGVEMALTDAVRLAGSVIHSETAWIRIKTGWTPEKAVETPKLMESHAAAYWSRFKSRLAALT